MARRTDLLWLFASGALLAPGTAIAQMPTVSPSPGAAPVAPSTSGGAGAAAPGGAAPATGAAAATGDAAEEGGFYYQDGQTEELDESQQLGGVGAPVATGGPVPEFHVVRQGDTLWDICFFYFNNSWEWPRIWAYNPSITNPHWIYPGDLVRLHGKDGAEEPAPAASGEQEITAGAPALRNRVTSAVRLRQLAFVDRDARARAMLVAGAPDERRLLAESHRLYLEYPSGQPPKVGSRYAVYTEQTEVRHPGTGQSVGSYVVIQGEIRVLGVQPGKRALAVVERSYDAIERGMKVGPVPRVFPRVEPRSSGKQLTGTVVALLGERELIGAEQLVFLDLGARDGLAVGNRLFAVRSGDAYRPYIAPRGDVGQRDEKYPERAIAALLVVDVGQRTSAAVVTSAVQEAEVGDRVLMQSQR